MEEFKIICLFLITISCIVGAGALIDIKNKYLKK